MTKIYEAKDHVLIRTDYQDPSEHRHMAAHIIVSMEGPMKVYSDGTDLYCRGVLIPSGVRHRIDTQGQKALVFLFACTSAVAMQITKLAAVSDPVCGEIILCWDSLEDTLISDAYEQWFGRLLSLLGMTAHWDSAADQRILDAMEYIRLTASEGVTCRDAAGHICLSQDRFSHLFKREAGMTFSAYVICQRLMRVYAEVFHGSSITEAALSAGFSGSSHFADVNRRIFGMPMGRITENFTYQKVKQQESGSDIS